MKREMLGYTKAFLLHAQPLAAVTHGENYINPKFRKELGRSWH
jgi:hypothetical protein